MHIFWLIVLHILFFVQGASVSIIGPIWPRYVSEYGIETSKLGMVTAIMFTTAMIGELSSFKLRKKIGNTYTLLLGFLLTTAFIVLMYIASNVYIIFVAVCFLGYGMGLVDATVNAFAGLYYEARHVSWIYAVYCIGGVVSSLIIANSMLPGKNFKMAFVYTSMFVICCIVLLIITKIILKNKLLDTGEVGKRVRDEKADTNVSMLSVLKNKYVIILIFVFFLVDGLKWIINAWLPTYFVNVGMSTEEFAAKSLSYFLGSYMISRVIFGFLSNKFRDSVIITISLIISIIGAIVLLIPNTNNIMIIIGVIIYGFGTAPLFPFFIHYTNEVCTESETGAVIAYAGTVAVLGDVFQSIFMGLYVKYVGINHTFLYLLILTVVLGACYLVLRFRKKV